MNTTHWGSSMAVLVALVACSSESTDTKSSPAFGGDSGRATALPKGGANSVGEGGNESTDKKSSPAFGGDSGRATALPEGGANSVGEGGTGQKVTYSLSYAAAPADNPLKGFVPFAKSSGASYEFPHSMEYFYIPLSELQTDFETFVWEPFDAKLRVIAARKHQAVMRVYLDYPNRPYGVPNFLLNVTKRDYTEYKNGTTDTSYSPDYNDADLQRALLSFIAAFGKRYDSDPRVGYVTVGLIGFWGEWHTSPHTEWMPDATFLDAVLSAYSDAFPTKMVLVREPKPNVVMDRPRLGFHDDSFAYQTLGDVHWHFWPRMLTAGLDQRWKVTPIGGEVRPEVQACIWDATSCTPEGQDYGTCVATTHATWLLNQKAFDPLDAEQHTRALRGAEQLGYELFISQGTVSPARVNGPLEFSVTLENRGVSPFYYPWTVKLAALDANGTVLEWNTEWDLRSVVDAPQTWTHIERDHGLAAGTYTLLLGVPNPMTDGKPLRFANVTQDQHRDGWLTIGTFNVE